MSNNIIGILIVSVWLLISCFIAQNSKVKVNDSQISFPVLWFGIFTVFPAFFFVIYMFAIWFWVNYFN